MSLVQRSLSSTFQRFFDSEKSGGILLIACTAILPIFALANTAIPVGMDWIQTLASANSAGIAAGLVVGKPLGITLFCFVAVASGLCRLPPDLDWRHVFGAGILGGIGFTMSIFIANLAFAGNAEAVNASKVAILLASLAAGTLGYVWLRRLAPADTGPRRNRP